MTTVGTPKIDTRPEMTYMGIRIQTPMSGMSVQIGKIKRELEKWFKSQGIVPTQPPFLRFHVINMEGEMDIEYGIPVASPLEGNERVKAALIPAGRYASLIYVGSGYTGNKALIEWAREQGLEWDRWDSEKGDNFRSRYETFLTDPKIEHRKTKWDVEVAIKLAD